jgi:hypothetical protein
MKRALFLLLLASCGSEDDEPFTCSQSDRAGTYLMHLDERPNGTCGPASDELVRLDGSGGIGDTCAFDAPDTWSADQCRLDRSITCCDGGFCTTVVGFTEQQDETGSEISGVLTLRIQEIGLSGTVIDGCASTYDVTAARQ